jgi:hypothetical protein
MRCNAKNRRGEQCGRDATPGRNVCNLHGGKSPRGIGSATFRHGRYSDDLPTRLATRLEECLNDAELLNLRREIALTDVELSETLRAMEQHPASIVWRDLHEAVSLFRRARLQQNLEEMEASLTMIFNVVERGVEQEKHWSKVDRLIERRRRLCESETRRELAISQELTYDSVTTLFAALTQAVRDSVPPAMAETIRKKFDELTTRQDQPRLDKYIH